MQDEILLEPSQEKLLSMLDDSQISHPRIREQFSLNKGDIEVLIHAGSLLGSYSPRGTLRFDVAPNSLRYYERLKQRDITLLQRITEEIKTYFVTKDL